MSIGKRFKEIKIALKMTSNDIAMTLKMPVRTIGSYERDEAQPGPKFLQGLYLEFGVNVNWLLTGQGTMFFSKKSEFDASYITQMKQKFSLNDEELDGLLEILKSDASREMVLKLIKAKKGDKEALDSLIYNLQGIKAFL